MMDERVTSRVAVQAWGFAIVSLVTSSICLGLFISDRFIRPHLIPTVDKRCEPEPVPQTTDTNRDNA